VAGAAPGARRKRSTPQRVTATARGLTPQAMRCRKKFLRFFPGGFADETYVDWERGYKWQAHERWVERLAPTAYRELLDRGRFSEITEHAVRVESRTNLLFSFEKMALRDAVKSPAGSRRFAEGLYEFLYGSEDDRARFEAWCEAVAGLPRRQTRVLTWPLLTVFGFIAEPTRHMFLKPNVTRIAAKEYAFDFEYKSRPNWETYESLLRFAATVRRDVRDLSPRDMMDLQSFIWVQGSDEYEE
jgi:hypothetical protein